MAQQLVDATDVLNVGRIKYNANDTELYADVATATAAASAASSAAATAQGDIDAHELLTNNPHSVTATQVGLGSVDNTADTAKPVSTAQAAADALKLDRNLTIKTKIASHTLDAADLTDLNAGKDILFLMNVAAGHTFTIPTNATVDIDAGGHIYVMRIGLGQTTFVGAGPPSVTGSSGSLLDPGANILMPIFQTADNVWYVQNGSGGAYTTWNPGFTGFSANPGSVDATYVVIGKLAHVRASMTNGTSNTTGFTITGLPVAPRVGMNFISLVMNNGATATGRIDITAGTTTMTLYATAAAGNWTASGNKNAYLNFIMEVQ